MWEWIEKHIQYDMEYGVPFLNDNGVSDYLNALESEGRNVLDLRLVSLSDGVLVVAKVAIPDADECPF